MLVNRNIGLWSNDPERAKDNLSVSFKAGSNQEIVNEYFCWHYKMGIKNYCQRYTNQDFVCPDIASQYMV